MRLMSHAILGKRISLNLFGRATASEVSNVSAMDVVSHPSYAEILATTMVATTPTTAPIFPSRLDDWWCPMSASELSEQASSCTDSSEDSSPPSPNSLSVYDPYAIHLEIDLSK
ncbi:hypothetical protein HAX54_009996 [Datura stramonium]|uniref:Uncharacterized protein n=1 Tax=Datura stramonium TaxID=4076 RepID=A0ABS8TFL2_DATST|nr:hypothetical protein [Datura stramonium]